MKTFIKLFLLGFTLVLLPANVSAATNGFDMPAGKPDGVGYSTGSGAGGNDGWGFLEWNGELWHPGEDWNRGSGETDFGDPVYSIGDGAIVKAADLGFGWGKSIVVSHEYNGSKLFSFYTHLSDYSVAENTAVIKGQQIGKIGNANGRWASHLHFEVRRENLPANFWPKGLSQDQVKAKYYSPYDFINANRPVASQNITGTVAKNQSDLIWDKNTSTNFDRYEIYRATTAGGTENPATRSTISTIIDQNATTFSDQNLPAGNYFYKIATFYKNGMVAYSNEFSTEIKREITKITTTTADQRAPIIYDGKIYWQDIPNGGTNNTGGLYSYDIKTGKIEVKTTSNCNFKFAYAPSANHGKVAFYGATSSTSAGDEVCYYNIATDTFLPISLAPIPKEQWYPTVTESGLIIWEDRRSGNFDLYYLDPSKSEGPQVFVTAFGQQINPRTSGSKVIWKDNRANGNYDIFMKDINGGSETKIAETAGDDFADIWDKYIVWDYRGKLFLKNIETGETNTLQASGVGYNPRINDGKVAYTLVEGSSSYIHIYDIATGKDQRIEFPLSFQSNLFVTQAYLVFDSTDKATPGDADIYLTQL